MATLIESVETFEGIQWQRNIYFSRSIDGPAQPLDCMNECVNVQSGVCHLFVFENRICYLGREDITNGTVAVNLPHVTVYALTGIPIFCTIVRL